MISYNYFFNGMMGNKNTVGNLLLRVQTGLAIPEGWLYA
ncbi:hypothetical protein FLA_5828 [Filimonas lacunae]|nr:hypothetical protein FLA_5828 [Filimonas lacunae]